MRKLFAAIATLCLLVILMPVDAKAADSGNCGESAAWTLDDNGTLIISGSGAMDFRASNGRAPWMEHREDVKRIMVEEGITTVCATAFEECINVEEVQLPDGLTGIEYGAFENCRSVTTLELPDSVTQIGDGAFSWMCKLEGMVLPQNMGRTIPRSLFENCASLKWVMIPEKVTTVDYNAFYGCVSLRDVYFGDDGFYPGGADKHGLVMGKYGNSASDSGNGALDEADWHYNEVQDFSCGQNAMWSLSDEGVLTIHGSGVMSDGAPWSGHANEIKKIVVEEGVTHIGDWAFSGCSEAESVWLPDSLTSIGKWVFRSCSKLTSIPLPDGLSSIGEGAFAHCDKLVEIDIPDGVTRIETLTFLSCENLKRIAFGAKMAQFGYIPIYSGSSLTDIYYGGEDREKIAFYDNLVKDGIQWHYGESGFENAGVLEPEKNQTDRPNLGEGAEGGIIWTVDAAGTLTITGNGEICDYDLEKNPAPWWEYRKAVKKS